MVVVCKCVWVQVEFGKDGSLKASERISGLGEKGASPRGGREGSSSRGSAGRGSRQQRGSHSGALRGAEGDEGRKTTAHQTKKKASAHVRRGVQAPRAGHKQDRQRGPPRSSRSVAHTVAIESTDRRPTGNQPRLLSSVCAFWRALVTHNRA